MKKLSALPVLALLFLFTMPLASGQNLPASMAFPDCATSGNLQFLDVSFPVLDEFPAHQTLTENQPADTADQPAIVHSSATVLSALGLVCIARRKR